MKTVVENKAIWYLYFARVTWLSLYVFSCEMKMENITEIKVNESLKRKKKAISIQLFYWWDISERESESCSVVFNFLRPHRPYIQSMEFSRPEYWSGYTFPFLTNLPDPRIKPGSPAFQVDSLSIKLWGTYLECINNQSQVFIANLHFFFWSTAMPQNS